MKPIDLVMNRRAALSAFGLLGGIAVIGSCNANSVGDSTAPDASSGTTDGGGTTGTDADGTCTETPEGEIGPYFADDSADGFNRSNVLSNLDGSDTQTGIPFTLTVYVYDAKNSCTAMSGVQIDIWHCNASGVYSDIAAESTSTQQWLRGYQLTDATGKVSFTTIIPGWYQGRTTHIHLRLRSSYSEASSTTDGTNTTQMFFPQALVNSLSTSVAPYNAEGTNPTTNASDRVYSQEVQGVTLMSPTGDTTNGYAATVSLYLPIA